MPSESPCSERSRSGSTTGSRRALGRQRRVARELIVAERAGGQVEQLRAEHRLLRAEDLLAGVADRRHHQLVGADHERVARAAPRACRSAGCPPRSGRRRAASPPARRRPQREQKRLDAERGGPIRLGGGLDASQGGHLAIRTWKAALRLPMTGTARLAPDSLHGHGDCAGALGPGDGQGNRELPRLGRARARAGGALARPDQGRRGARERRAGPARHRARGADRPRRATRSPRASTTTSSRSTSSRPARAPRPT